MYAHHLDSATDRACLDIIVLVLISTIWAQRTKWTLTRALIGGAQPMEGWWAPVAQPHKKR